MIAPLKDKKVAIVCDWLLGGGAERVVYELHNLFPKAPIYTAYCNSASQQKFKKATIYSSYMQRWPLAKLRKFLPVLRQHWFENLDLREYDLVISSSGAEAKGIRQLKPGAVHINYCHSPNHYYWIRHEEYLKHPGFGALDPVARVGLKLLVAPNRRWDFKAAQRPTYLVANSTCVQERIERYYQRESTVIHPPVDTKRFQPAKPVANKAGFVVAGRQTPYKKFDLAVAACSLANLPLLVIGEGPEHRRLKRLAGPSVRFANKVLDREIPTHFQQASGFIFPNEDDFGITPVEAMAAGTPVIAYKAGGALDYVVPGKTGVFFSEQTPEALADKLKDFRPATFTPSTLTRQAEQFSVERFRTQMQNFISRVMAERNA